MTNYDLLILILALTLLVITALWAFKHFCNLLRFQRFKGRDNTRKSAQHSAGHT